MTGHQFKADAGVLLHSTEIVGRSEDLLVGKKDADGGGDNQQAQHQRDHQFDQRDATSALQRLRKSFEIHVGTLMRTLVVTLLRALFAPSTPSTRKSVVSGQS